MGHLILAMEACGQLQLDKLLWVVTPAPPHKVGHTISPVSVRLKLIKAAIEMIRISKYQRSICSVQHRNMQWIRSVSCEYNFQVHS